MFGKFNEKNAQNAKICPIEEYYTLLETATCSLGTISVTNNGRNPPPATLLCFLNLEPADRPTTIGPGERGAPRPERTSESFETAKPSRDDENLRFSNHREPRGSR